MENSQLLTILDNDIEVKSNRYNLRCCKITIILCLVMLLGNELGIALIDKELMRITCLLVEICLIFPLLISKVITVNNKYFKYIMLFSYVICIIIINSMLTYHMTITLGIPFLMAAHYKEKKLSIYVYLITVIGIFISVIFGYLYGLSDLNFLYETTGPTTEWNNTIKIYAAPLNTEVFIKLFIYFILPRIVICLIYAVMGYVVANGVNEADEEKNKIQFESIHDEMTGLFNKKHYEYMKENVYKNMDYIGIIFFDVNNLKYINDNLGHEKGDELIIMAAQSISNITSNDTKAYRIGGDEFVLIVEEPQKGQMKNLKIRWQRSLDKINQKSDSIKCNIAIGMAKGEGKNIDEIYVKADKEMYIDKRNKKKALIQSII